MKLMYTYGVVEERITLEQMVAVTATNPARLFGMYPQKGIIAKGADADIVIWDKEGDGVISAATSHHRVDTSIFEGFKTVGGPRIVISNGNVCFEDNRLSVTPGDGRFIPRTPGGLA